MKHPTEVLIRGHRYKIEYVKRPIEVDSDMERTDYIGSCSHLVIRSLATQDFFSGLDTLLHEIAHAVFRKNPLLLQALKSEDLEEAFISTLANEIALLVTENGWLTEFEDSPPITDRLTKDTK